MSSAGNIRCNVCGSSFPGATVGVLCTVCTEGQFEASDGVDVKKVEELEEQLSAANERAKSWEAMAQETQGSVGSMRGAIRQIYRAIAVAALLAIGLSAFVVTRISEASMDGWTAKLDEQRGFIEAHTSTPLTCPVVADISEVQVAPEQRQLNVVVPDLAETISEGVKAGVRDDLMCEVVVSSRLDRFLEQSKKSSRDKQGYKSWVKEIKRKEYFGGVVGVVDEDRMWGLYMTIDNAEHQSMAMAFIDSGFGGCLVLDAMSKFDAWDVEKRKFYDKWVDILESDIESGKRKASESSPNFQDACWTLQGPAAGTGRQCRVFSEWGYHPDDGRLRSVLTSVKARRTTHEEWTKSHT